jgi:hypothetical protein
MAQADAYTDKVVGSFLAALCADALGSAVEQWTAKQVQRKFPDGMSLFQPCTERMGLGRYTGEHSTGSYKLQSPRTQHMQARTLPTDQHSSAHA